MVNNDLSLRRSTLSITRLQGESVVIGDGPARVTLQILRVKRKKIRLGITAPRDIPIVRAELIRKGNTNGNN